MKTAMLFLSLLAFVSLSGCGSSVDEFLAEQAVDSTDLAQSESGLTVESVSDYDFVVTPEQLAQRAAANASNRFSPGSCVTATASGPTITYQLNDCTGRFGLVHVTGTLVATFSPVQGGIQAKISGAGLKVNRATLELNSVATYTRNGSDEILAVNTQAVGVGPRGNTVTRQGDYLLSWNDNSECLTLDGNWETVVGLRTWTTDVLGFEKCRGSCPKAGGKITWHGGIRNVTITVDFDGDDTANWKSTRRGSGTIDLFCTP